MNSNVIRIMPVHQRVESPRYPSCFSIQESLDSPPRSTERGYITCSLRPCDGSDSSSALLSASLDHCTRRGVVLPSRLFDDLTSLKLCDELRQTHPTPFRRFSPKQNGKPRGAAIRSKGRE